MIPKDIEATEPRGQGSKGQEAPSITGPKGITCLPAGRLADEQESEVRRPPAVELVEAEVPEVRVIIEATDEAVAARARPDRAQEHDGVLALEPGVLALEPGVLSPKSQAFGHDGWEIAQWVHHGDGLFALDVSGETDQHGLDFGLALHNREVLRGDIGADVAIVVPGRHHLCDRESGVEHDGVGLGNGRFGRGWRCRIHDQRGHLAGSDVTDVFLTHGFSHGRDLPLTLQNSRAPDISWNAVVIENGTVSTCHFERCREISEISPLRSR